MSKFATPQWDSTDFGDEMCSKLFQGNKNLGKKKQSNIKKAKEKLKKLNPKVLQNIGKQMTEVKNKINGKLSKDSESVNLNSSSNDFPKKKGKKQRKKKKINGELLGNLSKKIREFSTEKLGKNPKDSKKKKTRDIKKLPMDINKLNEEMIKKQKIKDLSSEETEELNENPKNSKQNKTRNIKKNKETTIKQKLENKMEKIRDKIKDTNLVNDVSEKYTKTTIQLKKRRNNEDTETLLYSPKKTTKTLRERMLEQLKASRFRYLNEQIYTTESKNAQELFQNDPDAFQAYHEGYRQQVKRWPINPVDVIIKDIKKMSKHAVIADLGCGDAKLALELEQKVHSFDLIATNEHVVACDMSKVPLEKNSMDVVVFCLSLMGTNLHDYLKEANRLLKIGGVLKIAEVESRFDDVDNFIKGVQHFGFQNVKKDFSYNLFYFMDFKKVTNIKKTKGLPTLSLHPCLYKKR